MLTVESDIQKNQQNRHAYKVIVYCRGSNKEPTLCHPYSMPGHPSKTRKCLHWGAQVPSQQPAASPSTKKQTPLNHARISARTFLHHSAWQQQQQQQQRNLFRPLPEFARVRAVWVQKTRRPSCGGARTKYSSSRGLPTRPPGLPFVVAQERRAASQ